MENNNTENNNSENGSTDLAVVKTMDDLKSQMLKTSNDKEVKQLAKWKVNELMEFKDRKLGSLKSQLRYLKSNKLTEFKALYLEDKTKFNDLVNSEYKSLNVRVEKALDKIKSQMKLDFIASIKQSGLKEIENEVSKDIYFYTSKSDEFDEIFENKINYDEFSNVISSRYTNFEVYKSNKDLDSVISLKFEILSGKFFKDTENQITDLETNFEKALLFNDLGVAYQIYEQLEKADTLLEKVSNHDTPKEHIDFSLYMIEENFRKLEKEVEDLKKYEFTK